MRLLISAVALAFSSVTLAHDRSETVEDLGDSEINERCWAGTSGQYKARLGIAYSMIPLLIVETEQSSFKERPAIGQILYARVAGSDPYRALITQVSPRVRLSIDMSFIGHIFYGTSVDAGSDTIQFYRDAVALPAGVPMASPELTRAQLAGLLDCYDRDYQP